LRENLEPRDVEEDTVLGNHILDATGDSHRHPFGESLRESLNTIRTRGMNMSKFSFPVGALASVLIFLYIMETDLWSKLNWLSGTLFGLALIILFFSDMVWEN
jgi:uncharacterized integral membrane protein